MVGVFTRPAPRTLPAQAPKVEGLCRHPRRSEVPQPCIDELLGTLAHELRSPCATILSAVQMITDDCDVDLAAQRALAVVERPVAAGHANY